MANQIWECVNYKSPIRYLLNTYIREYDLSKANINALLYQGRISIDQYVYWESLDKQSREVEIGQWIKNDPSVYKDIQAGIIAAKKEFCTINHLDEYDILSIKNDAIFVIGDPVLETIYGPFQFKEKNIYTIFCQLQDLEVYYTDTVQQDGSIDTKIDIKGMNQTMLNLHTPGMLDLICDTCYRLQRENIQTTIEWICSIYQQFVTRALPKEYYRSFDSYSEYNFSTLYSQLYVADINSKDIVNLNINRNLSILRDLVSIVSDVYQQRI